jgi:hypothetical protein
MTLTEIAKEVGCNKLGFERYYDILFDKFRDLPITIFEIGILKGESLAMWYAYFQNAKIYGIDIEESSVREIDKRIKLFCIDQSDEEKLRKLGADIEKIDIVIDDGSHIGVDIIISFKVLSEMLSIGGLYCIEDILPSEKDIVDEYMNKIYKNGKFKVALIASALKKGQSEYLYVLERIK